MTETAHGAGERVFNFRVNGMSCVNCANSLEAYLSSVEGVKSVSVDFTTGLARIAAYGDGVSETRLVAMIAELGFEAAPEPGAKGEKMVRTGAGENDGFFDDHRLLAAVIFAFPVFVLNMFYHHWRYAPPLMSVLTLPPLLYSGFPFHKKAFVTVKNRLPLTMDALISAGSIASFLLSVFTYYFKGSHEVYFDSAASIIAVILIGKRVEERMRRRSRGSLGGIIDGMPDYCTVEKEGRQLEIKVSEIRSGDALVIRPNSRVPVDCVVTAGEGFVENSVITGESAPVFRKPGDRLWAGSLNSDAIFFAKADADGRDSYIDRIEAMLDQALLKKARIQKTADAVAARFVPAIFMLAAATFGVRFFLLGNGLEFSAVTAISVIAIACPCALGLALPTAFYFGADTAARNGIVFTDPDSLHELEGLNAAVFDKTGTLTSNKLFVKSAFYAAAEEGERRAALRLAASAEKYSDHPAARALVEFAKSSGVEADARVTDYKTHGGLGISAVCDGRAVAAGGAGLVNPGPLAGGNGIVFFVSIDGSTVARFELAETLNEGAAGTVERLRAKGIEVFLLSGDTAQNAFAVAAGCGIEAQSVRHSMKPDEKADFIKKLKAERPGIKIAMIGDGVNDALAMAVADIAIAMADSTNIAKTAANIILTGRGLENAVNAIEIGRKMRRVIRQNFFWAFFYNAVLIPSAMSGSLNPMQAALAMAASSIFVVANSTRLKKI